MKKFFNRTGSIFFTVIFISFLVISSPAQTQEQSGDWEKEWQRTIQAAKNEGKLVHHSGNSAEPYFQVSPKFWISRNGLKGDTISPTRTGSTFSSMP